MLRASTGLLRASAKAGKWQQCMKLSTTNIINSASAATPEPQTNPPILYTGVSFSQTTVNFKSKNRKSLDFEYFPFSSYSSTTNGTKAKAVKFFQP